MVNFIGNLILFSPLLVIAAAILYLLDRGPTLRAGAGLVSPPNPPTETATYDDEVGDEAEEPLLQGDDVPAHDAVPNYDEESQDQGDSESEPESEPPANADGGAPAAAQPQPRQPRTRTVGPKKAASLARRDARRAHSEFIRSQAALRAEAEKAALEEAEAIAYENALRRAVIEEEIAARKEEEKKRRRDREEAEEKKVRDEVMKGVRKGRLVLRGQDPRWEKMLRREGLVGVLDGGEAVGLITKGGEWVKVGRSHIDGLWKELERKGDMGWGEMATWLEMIIEGKGKGIEIG